MKKEQKLKLIIVFVFLVIGVCAIVALLWQRQQHLTVSEMLHDYVKDYTVKEQLEDGSAIISFQAPDFSQIIAMMAGEVDYEDISTIDLANAVQENQELVKEYTVFVESLNEENIEKAFSSQIAYELLIQAIEQSEEVEEGEKQ